MDIKSFFDIKTPVGTDGTQCPGAIFNNSIYVRGFFALEIRLDDGTVELHNSEEDWMADLDNLLINGEPPVSRDDVAALAKQFEPFTNSGEYTLAWDDVGGNIYSNSDLTKFFIASNNGDTLSGEGDVKNIYKEIILKNPDTHPIDTTFLRGQAVIRSYGAFFTDLSDPRNSVGMSAYGSDPEDTAYRPQIDIKAADGGHVIIKPSVIHLEDPDGTSLDIDTSFSGGGGGVTAQGIYDHTADSQTVTRDIVAGKVEFTATGIGGSTTMGSEFRGTGTTADPYTQWTSDLDYDDAVKFPNTTFATDYVMEFDPTNNAYGRLTYGFHNFGSSAVLPNIRLEHNDNNTYTHHVTKIRPNYIAVSHSTGQDWRELKGDFTLDDYAGNVLAVRDFHSNDFVWDTSEHKLRLVPHSSPITTMTVDYAEMEAGHLTEHTLANPPVGSALLGTWTLSSGTNLSCKGPEVCIFAGVDENGVQQDIQYTLHNKHASAIPAGKVIFTFM